MTKISDFKTTRNLPDPIYTQKPYVVTYENVVLAAGTLEVINDFIGKTEYYDNCDIDIRRHDLHMNDNTKVDREPKDEAVTVSKSLLLQLEKDMQELRRENAKLAEKVSTMKNVSTNFQGTRIIDGNVWQSYTVADVIENGAILPHSIEVEDYIKSLILKIAELEADLANTNEGAKIMHSVAMKGEQSVLSRLDGDADLQDLTRWQDESEATRKSDYPV